MDKQVLTSTQASEDVSRYSVGILREGRCIMQMFFLVEESCKDKSIEEMHTCIREFKSEGILGDPEAVSRGETK